MSCHDCSNQSEPIAPCRQGWLWVGCAVALKSPRCKLTVRTCLVNAARAFWRCGLVRFCALLVCVVLVALLAGCKTAPAASNRPPIDAKPLLLAHEGKDRAIVDLTAKIDANVDAWFSQFPAPYAAEIKAATAAQREEVAKAPAAQFNVIIDAMQKNASDDAKTIATLRKELASARDSVDRVIRIGGYALAGILGALAAASLFLAAQVPWLGPRISAALGAASVSIFAMVWAYEWTKQHPWITAITGACILVAAALAYANHLHDKSKPLTLRK